ncbi:MAG: hypothetical protein Fur002_05420 [Anaerolineales bacterium]
MNAVLFLATSSNINPGGGRTRIVDIAREARARGFSPFVLCFFYPAQAKKGFKFLAEGRARLERDAACPVTYLPMLPFTQWAWMDALNNSYCGWMIFLVSLWRSANVIYGHGTKAGGLALLARALSKKIKVISDIQGAVADERIYAERLSPQDKSVQRLLKDEAQALTQSNRLIFVSHAMQTHYEKKFGATLAPAAILPCAARADFALNESTREQIRREYGISERLVICYSGSVRAYQLPDAMAALFAAIRREFPQAFFLIFSREKTFFENLLQARGISSEDYRIEFAPQGELFSRLQAADAGLLLRDNSIVNRVASPTKFAEYLLCGLPVITTNFIGDYSAAAGEHRIGQIVDLNRLAPLDSSTRNFLQDLSANRQGYAARCAQFARANLTWNIHGEQLSTLLTF